ncbi:MAG: CpaD family pilus assembly lipoprotein [Sphingomicrobium sp.]
MNRKPAVLLIAALLAGCGHTPNDVPSRGLAAVNVPVVTRADYVVDLSAPGGSLLPGESQRLNGWFQGLDLGYGDAVYVDGPYAESARTQVAQVAGNYGLLVNSGAPITAGALPEGVVRVVVSRNRAVVPNCPNWSVPAAPNYQNQSHSNYGCAVNTNIAAMIANPEDLVHGREGSSVIDAQTSNKALTTYRSTQPTGSGGLKETSTKESK